MSTLSNEVISALKTLNSFINEKRHSELHSVDELNEMMSLANELRCNPIRNACSRRACTILLKNEKKKALAALSTATKVPFSLADVLGGYYTPSDDDFLASNGREIRKSASLSLDIAKVKDEAMQHASSILSQNNIEHSLDGQYVCIQSKDLYLVHEITNLVGRFFKCPDDILKACLVSSWRIDTTHLKPLNLPDFYFPHMKISYTFKDTRHEGRREISGIDIFQRPKATKAVAAKRSQ